LRAKSRNSITPQSVQVAGELGGPGTPSHGQRQSRAVDEESVVEGWVNESSAGTVSVNRGRTKVAHRVERGKVHQGGWIGAAAARARMVRDEGRSRKPRATRKNDNLECNSRRGPGLYSWQSGEGARYPIRWDASRFDSNEMSPLYENRCLIVGLVQMRLP
jgi:hypothetical protein